MIKKDTLFCLHGGNDVNRMGFCVVCKFFSVSHYNTLCLSWTIINSSANFRGVIRRAKYFMLGGIMQSLETAARLSAVPGWKQKRVRTPDSTSSPTQTQVTGACSGCLSHYAKRLQEAVEQHHLRSSFRVSYMSEHCLYWFMFRGILVLWRNRVKSAEATSNFLLYWLYLSIEKFGSAWYFCIFVLILIQ